MAAGLARERRPCFVYDLRSKLLTLGNTDASIVFRSLTRNFALKSPKTAFSYPYTLIMLCEFCKQI